MSTSADSSPRHLSNRTHSSDTTKSRFSKMLGSNDLSGLAMVNTEIIENLKSSGNFSRKEVAELAGYSDTSVLPQFSAESLPTSVLVHILNYQTFTLLFLNESNSVSKLEVETMCSDLFETTADLVRLKREKIQEKIDEGVVIEGEKYEYLLDDFGNLACGCICIKKGDTIIMSFDLPFSKDELRILEGGKGSEFGVPYYKLSIPDTSISFLDYAGMIRTLDMRHEAVREQLKTGEQSLLITHRTTGAFLTVYSSEEGNKESGWTLKRYFGYFGAVQTLAWCWLVDFYRKYDLQRRKLICPDPGWKCILIKNSIAEAYTLLQYARPRISSNWTVHPESCIPFLANVAFKQTVSVLYKANLSLPVGEMEQDIYFINYFTEVGMPCPKFLCASDPYEAYPKQWIECISSSILAAIDRIGHITVLEEIILIDKGKR